MGEGQEPVLQIALDFINLQQALRAARESVAGGAAWVEAGTPLIKSEGLDVVRALRKEFPEHTIIADMKIMDAGRVEVETAAKAGANVVTVLGAASDATIAECVEAGRSYVHTAIDVQMTGGDPLETVRAVAAAVEVPVAVAGGINSETAPEAVKAGADIVVVGGAINKAPDAEEATRVILEAMRSGRSIATEFYKRGGEEQLGEIFARCSAANISDAMGDWSKPVQAIDEAEEGAVIVVDVRGEGPAIWGEEASKSCRSRGVAGVVINGAARDTGEIRELGFPLFCALTAPAAGEPKGMGMIGVPLKIGETAVRTGDWVIGDDDGVIVVPREQAVEMANRALSVVEREAREKAEIEAGRTLGQVAELERWEQEGGATLKGFKAHGPEGDEPDEGDDE